MVELNKEESPEAGVRRMLLELMADAEKQLREFETPDENVHEARKDFKKARALLRMVRKDIGEDAYKKVNIAFRDAGRKLSDIRDAGVLHQTVEQLRERYDDLLTDEAFATIATRLKARHDDMLKEFIEERRERARIMAILDELRPSVEQLPVSSSDFGAYYGGIKKVFKRGRKAAETARADTSTTNLHDWRKRAKYLYYQLGYLRPLWPKELKAFENSLNQLANLLGDDHDLALLAQVLKEEPGLHEDPKQLELLTGVITAERNRLQKQLWPVAKRLYKEEPSQFANRLAAYWVAMKMEMERLD